MTIFQVLLVFFGYSCAPWRTREADGIAAKSLQRGIASKTLRQNLLLRVRLQDSAGRIHHMMRCFSAKNARKTPEILTNMTDVLEPLKQALLASRDVKIPSHIFGLKLKRVFTLGDGCWLPLVGPYCAILLRAMGSSVSQHGQLGAIPPPPFLSVSPLESMRSGGAIPPPPKERVPQRFLRDTL